MKTWNWSQLYWFSSFQQVFFNFQILKTWNWSLFYWFSSCQQVFLTFKFWNPYIEAWMLHWFPVIDIFFTFDFWKPNIEACSVGFQVFDIFFAFKFWKPNIEACSIGFPVIGNKICFLGAPVRNQIVNVILYGHNIRFNIKKCWKVTGLVSELASYYWGRWGNLKVAKFCFV